MKAKIKTRINLENRTRLEEVIPLNTPFVIQIEPSSLCNSRCRFCPVGNHDLIKKSGVRQGMLETRLFKKAIDDLADFDNRIKAIHLYGNGEPFLNKNLHEMVKYTKNSGRVDFVDTTTNGLLLTPEKIRPVIEAGIDQINISVNGLTSEQYLKITQTKVDFDKLLYNLRYLYENRGNCKILIKSISELYSDKEKKKFFDVFSPFTDYISLENLTDPWSHYSVEENLGIKSGYSSFFKKIEDKLVCSPIFYSLVVNFDGTVSLCCVDWENRLIIGNIKDQSLKEIWNSDILFNHQLQHLKGERFKNPMCRDCNQIKQCIFDNIDPYRDELALKLQKLRLNKQ